MTETSYIKCPGCGSTYIDLGHAQVELTTEADYVQMYEDLTVSNTELKLETCKNCKQYEETHTI